MFVALTLKNSSWSINKKKLNKLFKAREINTDNRRTKKFKILIFIIIKYNLYQNYIKKLLRKLFI